MDVPPLAATDSMWDSLPSGIAAEVIAAAIIAVFALLVWRPLFARYQRWRHPEQIPHAEFTDEVREALLNRVRERSFGQLDDLIGLPGGYADLDLEPTVDLVKGWKTGEAVTITHGGNIFEMFDKAEGRLLITGEPGGGKTILLYKLAAHLDQRAAADASAPLPLVVNLSGWADNTTFNEWLVGYLCDPTAGYGLRDAGLAARLVDAHRFALLLDGLDEVNDSQRDRCLTAINDYVRSLPVPPSAPVVITCRIADYQALIDDEAAASQLRLLAAGRVHPLAEATVASNLRRIAQADPGHEREWANLRRAITNSQRPDLKAVLANPLLLSLAARCRLDPGRLVDQPDHDTAATYILDRFYRDALATDTSTYPENDARRWLGWLAKFTLTNPRGDSTAFYLEDLTTSSSPGWLNLTSGLVAGLAIGLAIGLLLGLVFGLVFGLVAGLLFGLPGVDSRPTQRMFQRPTRPRLKSGLAGWLGWGLTGGLAVGLAIGLFAGLGVSPVSGLVSGIVFGLVFGLVFGFSDACEVDFVVGEPAASDGGMTTSRRSWVGETIKWTLGGGLCAGMFAGLVAGLGVGLVFGLVFGLALGLVLGMVWGLDVGGGYVVRQWEERRRLRREGVLPDDPVGFYDWAVDRGVLRRVGGGWQFRHLLLRDLAAEQYEPSLITEVDQATASVEGDVTATDP